MSLFSNTNTKPKPKPKFLGYVENIEVHKGGFLSSTTTSIKTEKGIFQVYGDIGSIEFAKMVYSLNNKLAIGESWGKRGPAKSYHMV